MRISQKLQRAHEEREDATFSFEFFVPKTSQGVQNLYERMDRMYQTQPEFIDITWNAGGRLSMLSTDLVATSQGVLGLETCMHLTCTNMPVSHVDDALKKAYDAGCQNILALRGDPPINSMGEEEEWKPCENGFRYAKDLVAYIREQYGDHFDIGVAAYPEGHPECDCEEKLLHHLKEKVDCGADFMVTQMFYDVDKFIDWCAAVRKIGISIPIIPGIMPITSYPAFIRRTQWCQINVPENFVKLLEPVKDDDQLVREVGTNLMVELCQKLLDSGYVNHLHLYTMNLEKASLMILERLGLLKSGIVGKDAVEPLEPLPWRKSLNPKRRNELVRPIFWQKRPYSYVARTSLWDEDEFPNGRFGDSSSPAYGDLDLCGHSLIRQSVKKSIELWSKPSTLDDISNLVISYLEGKLKCLPWCDVPLNHEVDDILLNLIDLNRHNIFTINSQPKVNGKPSTDPVVGWGPSKGYVYQKEYLEFLLPKEKLAKFQEICEEHSDHLTYFAIDAKDNLTTNHPEDSRANAVTWGVFPGSEILQPTIVEKVSFLAWKEEFYTILQEWKLNFAEHKASDSESLVNSIIDNYMLVNVVDNDFISSNDTIFKLLQRLY
ncbi:unnamed protein product [Kluyveromyces dobzhanskii CBS 2104]|uniref:WGS project CCBQ000000000 data, contig 00015 n=1 Tax=Kluyveromyces dobzhanskii CBS 2104 TaxID=1427455 RepID=A0A0A8L9P6_9SACH|nr:unnamed protein product [Kluyveromyces dobzhanskii CBS 2104]